MKSKIGISFAVLAAILLSPLAADSFGGAKKPRPVDPSTLMKREETMVLNLQTGSKSAKYFVLHSLKTTRDMQRDLFKAMRQVETVDSNYAKARNRPDDRTLSGTVTRLKKAQATAEQLEKELELVNQELKSDIQSTLIRN